MLQKPTTPFYFVSFFAFAIFSLSSYPPVAAQISTATLTYESSQGSDDSDVGPTRILFVFDASNSMNAYWSGERKIVLATKLLSQSLETLYGTADLELGLRAYGHGTKHIEGQQDCDDTELIVPIKKGTNLIVKQELGRLQAQGTTPIARSLEKAAGDFPSEPGRNIIILITDGIEACDEDPCAVSMYHLPAFWVLTNLAHSLVVLVLFSRQVFVSDAVTMSSHFCMSPSRHYILICLLRNQNCKKNCLHFSICACHPCAGAMLIFSVSFQF